MTLTYSELKHAQWKHLTLVGVVDRHGRWKRTIWAVLSDLKQTGGIKLEVWIKGRFNQKLLKAFAKQFVKGCKMLQFFPPALGRGNKLLEGGYPPTFPPPVWNTDMYWIWTRHSFNFTYSSCYVYDLLLNTHVAIIVHSTIVTHTAHVLRYYIILLSRCTGSTLLFIIITMQHPNYGNDYIYLSWSCADIGGQEQTSAIVYTNLSTF